MEGKSLREKPCQVLSAQRSVPKQVPKGVCTDVCTRALATMGLCACAAAPRCLAFDAASAVAASGRRQRV